MPMMHHPPRPVLNNCQDVVFPEHKWLIRSQQNREATNKITHSNCKHNDNLIRRLIAGSLTRESYRLDCCLCGQLYRQIRKYKISWIIIIITDKTVNPINFLFGLVKPFVLTSQLHPQLVLCVSSINLIRLTPRDLDYAKPRASVNSVSSHIPGAQNQPRPTNHWYNVWKTHKSLYNPNSRLSFSCCSIHAFTVCSTTSETNSAHSRINRYFGQVVGMRSKHLPTSKCADKQSPFQSLW